MSQECSWPLSDDAWRIASALLRGLNDLRLVDGFWSFVAPDNSSYPVNPEAFGELLDAGYFDPVKIQSGIGLLSRRGSRAARSYSKCLGLALLKAVLR